MSKKDQQWQTASFSCAVCHKCKIYIEGPLAGKCIYNGPFDGYLDLQTGQLKTKKPSINDK